MVIQSSRRPKCWLIRGGLDCLGCICLRSDSDSAGARSFARGRAGGKVCAAYARVKVYVTRAVNHLLKNTSEYSRGSLGCADTLSVPSRDQHVLNSTSRERQGNALISSRRNGSADLTRSAGRTTDSSQPTPPQHPPTNHAFLVFSTRENPTNLGRSYLQDACAGVRCFVQNCDRWGCALPGVLFKETSLNEMENGTWSAGCQRRLV